MAEDITMSIEKDFGSFGDGKWSKHLCLVKWNNGEAKYDIRPWNEDMTKCGKGVTLTVEELMDLKDLIDAAIDSL